MTTPAKELYHLLKSVTANSMGAKFDRDNLTINSGVLVSRIENFLIAPIDNGKEYQFFKENLPSISRTIFNVVLGNTTDNAEIDKAKFALLTLHSLMEHEGVEPFAADEEDIRQIVTDLKRLVSDATDLPRDLRFYCFSVINSIEQELERFKTFGEFDTQTALERLTTAISVLASNGKDSDGSRFQKLRVLWEKIMGLTNFSDAALGAINGGADLAQLTTGSN